MAQSNAFFTNVGWLRRIFLQDLKQLLHVVGLNLFVVAVESVVGKLLDLWIAPPEREYSIGVFLGTEMTYLCLY